MESPPNFSENVENQRQQHDIAGMPNIDLPEDEYADVVAAARKVLDLDKYPTVSPRRSAKSSACEARSRCRAEADYPQITAADSADTQPGWHRARR